MLAVEPLRSSDVIFEAGSRRQRNSLIGVPEGASLNRVLDENMIAVQPRGDGLTLSHIIAGKLDVGLGDIVRIAGHRRPPGHGDAAGRGHREALPRRIRLRRTRDARAACCASRTGSRPPTCCSIAGSARPSARGPRNCRRIMSVSFLDNARESMRKLLEQGSGFFASLFVVFSSLMAAGVAFSSARVTLAEQERDLATLRVLGFGRGEASYVLLAEMGALLLVALPLGVVLGILLSRWLMSQFETELFTFPYVTNAVAYGKSALFVAAAVVAATLVVRRGVDRLDLVGVLKSRDRRTLMANEEHRKRSRRVRLFWIAAAIADGAGHRPRTAAATPPRRISSASTAAPCASTWSTRAARACTTSMWSRRRSPGACCAWRWSPAMPSPPAPSWRA